MFFYSFHSDPNRSPGRPSLNEWPLHTPKGKEYLELNSKYLHQADKSLAVGRGPRAKECAFWTEYLPKLVAATSKSSLPFFVGKLVNNSNYGHLMTCAFLEHVLFQIGRHFCFRHIGHVQNVEVIRREYVIWLKLQRETLNRNGKCTPA